jgi:hypothetical protein
MKMREVLYEITQKIFDKIIKPKLIEGKESYAIHKSENIKFRSKSQLSPMRKLE